MSGPVPAAKASALSDEDRDDIAVRVAARLASSSAEKPPWLGTAGQAVELVAGVVALIYSTGGLVLVARLLLDSVTIAEAITVVGLMSREFLITAGMVFVVGLTGLVGLIAGFSKYADPNTRYGPWLERITLPPVLTVIFLLPAISVQIRESGQSVWELAAFAVAVLGQYAAVKAGHSWWHRLRDANREAANRGENPPGLRHQGITNGLLWMGMTLPAALIFASFTGFEPARACLAPLPGGQQPPPVNGALIADTKDGVLMTVDVSPAGETTVVRVPPTRLQRLQYGADKDSLPECDSAATTARDA